MADRALDWNAEVTDAPREYENIILPEGTYDFTVKDITKKSYSPSPTSKLPPCNMVLVRIEIDEPKTGKPVSVFENLYLLESQAWKIADFFVCIGLMQPGETLRMNFDKAIGEIGKVKVNIHEYNGKRSNRVVKWLRPSTEGLTLDNKDLPF